MSLIVDGVRSAKRKWFADKLLEKIKTLGIQSKCLYVGGFLFRVKYQDESVNTRHIAAPMGAVVVSFGKKSVRIYAAEYWIGGFVSNKAMHRFDAPFLAENASASISGYNEHTTADLVLVRKNADTCQWVPFVAQNTKYVQPQAVLLPVGYFEDVALIYSSRIRYKFISIDEATSQKISEAAVLLFAHDGQQQSQSKIVHASLAFFTESTLFQSPWRNGLLLAVRSHWSYYEYQPGQSGGNILACLYSIRSRADLRTYPLYSWILKSVCPKGMHAILDKHSAWLGMGSYGFMQEDGSFLYVHLLRMTSRFGYVDPFFKDEANDKWRLFYFILRFPPLNKDMDVAAEEAALARTSIVAVSNNAFMGTLDDMSGGNIFLGGGAIDWSKAERLLHQIFVWPNFTDGQPHDSVMFHSADTVFSWSRAYGGVEIGTTGMRRVALFMPPEVRDNKGVRPEITYAGNGLYCCVCDNVGHNVLAVYVGTPFIEGQWTQLPLLPGEWAAKASVILHVRPITIQAERVALLAVVRELDENGTPRFLLTVADNTPAACTLSKISVIPAEDEDELRRFAVTLYGNGKYVQLLQEYLSPPAAVPQTLYRENYNEYAR